MREADSPVSAMKKKLEKRAYPKTPNMSEDINSKRVRMNALGLVTTIVIPKKNAASEYLRASNSPGDIFNKKALLPKNPRAPKQIPERMIWIKPICLDERLFIIS